MNGKTQDRFSGYTDSPYFSANRWLCGVNTVGRQRNWFGNRPNGADDEIYLWMLSTSLWPQNPQLRKLQSPRVDRASEAHQTFCAPV